MNVIDEKTNQPTKTTANIILNGERLDVFPPISGKRRGVSLSYFCSIIYWKGLVRARKKQNAYRLERRKTISTCR